METEHKTELKKRHEREAKKYIISVENKEYGRTIISAFMDIESALHKIELDLMTNLHFGFINPIKIMIEEVKDD